MAGVSLTDSCSSPKGIISDQSPGHPYADVVFKSLGDYFLKSYFFFSKTKESQVIFLSDSKFSTERSNLPPNFFA